MQPVQELLESFVTYLQQPGTLVQLIIIAATLGGSFFLHKTYFIRLEKYGSQSSGMRHVALRSLERLLWPVSWLILLWLSQVILINLDQPNHLLGLLLPLVFSFAAIRLILYILRKSTSSGPFLKAAEKAIALLIWALVGLHLLGWLPTALSLLDSVAISLGNFRISLLSGIKTAFFIAVGLTIATWLSSIIEHKLQSAKSMNSSTKVGLAKFIKFIFITLAILLVLSTLGIDISSLAVFGGALGVGLGFGLQRIAANFISGFIVIMDRSIKPGDIITVGDQFGWVQELKSRYIVLRNRDGIDTLIPNENFITNEVVNWSYGDRNVRIRIQVDISYGNDPEQAMQVVLSCAYASERVLQEPAPTISLLDFAESGVRLELRVWLADPEQGFENVRSAIRLAIWKAFKENEINIPYPQRDLHLKSIDKNIITQFNTKSGD